MHRADGERACDDHDGENRDARARSTALRTASFDGSIIATSSPAGSNARRRSTSSKVDGVPEPCSRTIQRAVASQSASTRSTGVADTSRNRSFTKIQCAGAGWPICPLMKPSSATRSWSAPRPLAVAYRELDRNLRVARRDGRQMTPQPIARDLLARDQPQRAALEPGDSASASSALTARPSTKRDSSRNTRPASVSSTCPPTRLNSGTPRLKHRDCCACGRLRHLQRLGGEGHVLAFSDAQKKYEAVRVSCGFLPAAFMRRSDRPVQQGNLFVSIGKVIDCLFPLARSVSSKEVRRGGITAMPCQRSAAGNFLEHSGHSWRRSQRHESGGIGDHRPIFRKKS